LPVAVAERHAHLVAGLPNASASRYDHTAIYDPLRDHDRLR
jgi:hypothetical protein